MRLPRTNEERKVGDMSDTREKRADMPDAEEDKVLHTVRFEPVGVEMTVAEGETVLDAAFRQGISVMHGCKEGQCSSCKSLLIEGRCRNEEVFDLRFA